MFWWDPTYIIILPAILLAMWAQIRVKSTFHKYHRYRATNGKTASEIAREILSAYGLAHIRIERISGNLTDHYDPKKKTLRLSESIYDSASIAAIGVAAHEAGHAIQHAKGYVPISLRNSIFPAVNVTSWASFPLIVMGFIFQVPFLIHLGITFFTGVVFFQLITLPVEFDASSRALKILKAGFFSQAEYQGAKKVLNAAALTYVASALTAILQLIRLLIVSGILDNED